MQRKLSCRALAVFLAAQQTESELYLVTATGERKPCSASPKVEPGSSLVVPERNFSRSEVAQIILSAAEIAQSGVAVLLGARK
jgi:hypothetical protein